MKVEYTNDKIIYQHVYKYLSKKKAYDYILGFRSTS